MQAEEIEQAIAVSVFRKILAPVLLYLFFWASQAMTLLRLPRLFLSADAVTVHPWIGMYYSIVRHRTGSLLNPVLAHGFGDGAIVSAMYLLYFALR